MELSSFTRTPKRPVKTSLLLNYKLSGGNIAKLATGVEQRAKILPPGPLLETNPKKIGFYNRENLTCDLV